ncbi:hypothetical protein IE53DRAFT_241267 [Violaceomyces palustris]|uniref:Uncharacterized protein n=1 Tax=Violaceomyces palustris TaxID=1673888 RepID=A0ACD0NP48_9BASI|nr:hypothetical protein IE53DRAFT_241267 [Violaceomyces palustris]
MHNDSVEEGAWWTAPLRFVERGREKGGCGPLRFPSFASLRSRFFSFYFYPSPPFSCERGDRMKRMRERGIQAWREREREREREARCICPPQSWFSFPIVPQRQYPLPFPSFSPLGVKESLNCMAEVARPGWRRRGSRSNILLEQGCWLSMSHQPRRTCPTPHPHPPPSFMQSTKLA